MACEAREQETAKRGSGDGDEDLEQVVHAAKRSRARRR
jgi:hypothetical protein